MSKKTVVGKDNHDSSSPLGSPVYKKSRKIDDNTPSPKHKYDIHYHDWTSDEIQNLIETVESAPADLRNKAKWRWIAKAMIN